MKAKCPRCNLGCDACNNGFYDVCFPAGPEYILWDFYCEQCGGSAGGCFTGPDLPRPTMGNAICPECGTGHHLKMVEVKEES